MAVLYPVEMPPMPPGPVSIELAQNFIVAENDSPFTAQAQIYEHQGSWWTAKVNMPALTRAQAAPWLAFLALLNGRSGTFLFGDPTIAGSLGAPGIPWSNPGGQTGKTLTISGLTGLLKAGDYFQVGGENRLLWSQAFDNAAWNYINATRPTPDTIVAPDGTTTAEALVSTSSLPQVYQNLPTPCFTPGQKYTFSVWLKAPAGALSVTLSLFDGTAVSGSNTVSLTTSWQRFSVTFKAAGSTVPQAGLFTWTNGVTVHAWGAQVELGTLVGSGNSAADYYPTTSAIFPSTRRLYMNLGDVSANPSTLDIFPRLRESPLAPAFAGFFLGFVNPRGLFRLDSNAQPWTVDNAGFYTIAFGAREAF